MKKHVYKLLFIFQRLLHICPHGSLGWTHCRHPANMIEPSLYGGDAPYVKLL